MKCCDTSLVDAKHVFITCVSQNKDPGGPWWEIRCHTANRRNMLLKKGPRAFSGLRRAVRLGWDWKGGRGDGKVELFWARE